MEPVRSSNRRRFRGGPALAGALQGLPLLGLAALAGFAAAAAAQPGDRNGERIRVVIRWSGDPPPISITGLSLSRSGNLFTGEVARPRSGLRTYDLEVNYADGSHPLAVRVHPLSQDVDFTIGLARPKSCADTFLRPLENETITQTASVRAAFTLNFMLDRPTSANSCAIWPMRAEKARFDRYYNAMRRSGHLVIPEAIKDAYRSAAGDGPQRPQVEREIAQGEAAEIRRFANIQQTEILREAGRGENARAHRRSALLLEAANMPELAAEVAREISLPALERQTADLEARIDPDR